MEIKRILDNESTVVKAVWCGGRFMYTVTYYKDADGYVDRMVRVYANGTVEEQ